MRLLHTSDWHLGRSFHREDLLSAQGVFVDALVAAVRSERVDAVVVSGDLYDRALPPVDAVALCNDALRRLAAERVPMVIISGNHDSARRLGFAADLIDAAGIHLRTQPERVGSPVLVPGRAGETAAIYGIPYLEPDAVQETLGAPERGHTAVLGAALDRIRADLAGRPADTLSVVLAHAFVVGGEPSDSERDIAVGGVGSVPAALFDGLSYTALGHLHGAQSLGERLRYSGSPLAYSFSEEHHRKSMSLVEVTAGSCSITPIDCPVPRPLARLHGDLEDLLTSPRWELHERAWVHVTLTDPIRPLAAMERLRMRVPHVLVLAFEPRGGGHQASGTYAARVAGLDDVALARQFVTEVRSAPDAHELRLLDEAFEAERRSQAEV